MTKPRSQLIDLDSTSYYHCISRCVRRAFLWGEDHLTGDNYTHRKAWVVDRLSELNQIFAIDVCAYAIMSNHYHLVLRVNQEAVETWSNKEVITRWNRLFSLPVLIQRYLKDETKTAEVVEVEKVINLWRNRLMDISWFMRSLNEYLARKANKEDNCTGRFWEGRYKSQALLDEAAVLTCMSYVDLNPIRAGIAELPESSDYTSIQQRIIELQTLNDKDGNKNQPKEAISIPLLPLTPIEDGHKHNLNFTLSDYIELVDWLGRVAREGKRGSITQTAPPVLTRLCIDSEQFVDAVSKQRTKFSMPIAIGNMASIKKYAENTGRNFIRFAREVTPVCIG